MAEVIKRNRGRPRSVSVHKEAGVVQALDRGLNLLSILARDGMANLTDLAMKTGMPPSTAHRLLSTMEAHGMVSFTEASQEWRVGINAFRIGNAFLDGTELMTAGRDVMRRLMEETGETANMAVAEAGDVVFVSQIETQQPIRAFFRPGTRSPMHVSGIGKALLAEMPRTEVEKVLQRKGLPERTEKTLRTPDALFEDLEKTRARGWSFDDEEATLGMRCVAAPIFNMYGEAFAGISVSGPTVRLTDRLVAEIAPMVRRAAADVTDAMGGKVRDATDVARRA